MASNVDIPVYFIIFCSVLGIFVMFQLLYAGRLLAKIVQSLLSFFYLDADSELSIGPSAAL